MVKMTGFGFLILCVLNILKYSSLNQLLFLRIAIYLY